MTQVTNIEKILLGLVLLGGSLILQFPIHYIFVVFFGGMILLFLLSNPKYCFYLLVFTIPFVERIRVLPISFSLNDIMVLMCLTSVLIGVFIKDERVCLKTRIDKWNLILLLLFFISGYTSVSSAGILTSFKFLEAIIVFYLTVYFRRTGQVTTSGLVKLIIVTALFQACLGTFQSFTGIGSTFRSSRGLLGYFGIGSSMVWHGMGTMGHFNMLGNFLVAITLFYMSIYYYFLKNSCTKKPLWVLGALFLGIITTYSRGSLIGLFFGGLYFLYAIMRNKFIFGIISTAVFSFVILLKNFLSNTSYVNTLSSRNDIWAAVISAILSNPRYLWFGGGLNSYFDIVYPFLPQDNVMWYAHSFYLVCLQEMGIIGFLLMFSFLIFLFIDTWKRFKVERRFYKVLNLSVSLTVFSVFFVSIFDHAYSLTFFKILLFLMLGIIYAKDKKIYN